MDTENIALYYKEYDPLKRKQFLEQSIAAGEEKEANLIRKELWENRYKGSREKDTDVPADRYLALWMSMEFGKDSSGRMFGRKGARKEIARKLKELGLEKLQKKSDLHRELLHRECVHMVKTYMELCEKDKTYNTTFFGIVPINEKTAKNKLQKDIYDTAVILPADIEMEEELQMITEAARIAYEAHFPGECLKIIRE